MIEKWWHKAVIYQIYPRSFQDSNGDGIGDLQGIISRLDYLERLGIDAIWLSPVYKSPQDDNGYDISDYKDIDPMFGTLKDMDQLIDEAKKHGIRIIMDLVLNHTSDEHWWFREAKKGRDNQYHDYYVWRDGTEGCPPNDMRSCFGGSAWQWEPEAGRYYFHQFSVKQPDLNWENPKVRSELYDIIKWWMERGIGGFRLDVIDCIAKEPDLKITNNGPRLHEFIRELSRETFQRDQELITVGEAWGATPEIAKIYSNPDGSEFSMVFQFEHIGLDQQEGKEKWDLAPLDFIKLKKVLAKWQTQLYGCGWNSLFWNNHDLPRIVSRWGNDSPEYREVSAKMLATVLHGMQGTPYIYQGEELGMTNVRYELDEYRDIELLNMARERLAAGYSKDAVMESIHAKGRDNARTPMQWDSGINAGFTSGTPWIRVNPNYLSINAAQQIDDYNSIFNYYRKLIALRKGHDIFAAGDFTLLYEEHPDIFAYMRRYGCAVLLVICNFHGSNIGLDPSEETRLSCMQLRPEDFFRSSELLICNYDAPADIDILRPYEARMYLHMGS